MGHVVTVALVLGEPDLVDAASAVQSGDTGVEVTPAEAEPFDVTSEVGIAVLAC